MDGFEKELGSTPTTEPTMPIISLIVLSLSCFPTFVFLFSARSYMQERCFRLTLMGQEKRDKKKRFFLKYGHF